MAILAKSLMNLFNSFDLVLYKSYPMIMIMMLLLMELYYKNNLFKTFFMTLNYMLLKILYVMKNYGWPKNNINLVYATFYSICFMNMLSLMPFVFSLTSSMMIIFYFGFMVWLMMSLFSIMKNINMFILHLTPEGSPLAISFFLVFIELTSLCIRPLTLSIRLVSNILSGHMLMCLLHLLQVNTFNNIFFLLVMFNTMELMVAIIQAYIFMTLISLYLSEI